MKEVDALANIGHRATHSQAFDLPCVLHCSINVPIKVDRERRLAWAKWGGAGKQVQALFSVAATRRMAVRNESLLYTAVVTAQLNSNLTVAARSSAPWCTDYC